LLPPFSSHPSPSTPYTHTLSLHDALPISPGGPPKYSGCPPRNRVKWFNLEPDGLKSRPRLADQSCGWGGPARDPCKCGARRCGGDRKSTRLNSSHEWISYAVFCLKKKQ